MSNYKTYKKFSSTASGIYKLVTEYGESMEFSGMTCQKNKIQHMGYSTNIQVYQDFGVNKNGI